MQFARSTRDGYPYAIKFYVSRTAFEAEKKLYKCAPPVATPPVGTSPVATFHVAKRACFCVKAYPSLPSVPLSGALAL